MGKSRGLGDTITKITKATGIDKVVKALWDDCGCEERANQLNKLFPYSKPNCLTEKEHKQLHKFYQKKPSVVTSMQQDRLLLIYNRVLNKNQSLSNCDSCVRNMVRELEKIYVQYKVHEQ